MSDHQEAEPAVHPEALAQWRALMGEPDAEAVLWAEQILGVAEAGRRSS